MLNLRHFFVLFLLFISYSAKSEDFFWVNGSGNWSDFANHWQNDLGAFYNRLPSDTDNVFFNAASFTATGQTVNIDVPVARCKSMIWSNATFSPTLTQSVVNDSLMIFGSLVFNPNMTNNYTANFVLATPDNDTIRTNGILFVSDVFFNQLGGYQLKDNFTVNGTIHIQRGTLRTNDFTLTAHNFNLNYFNFRELKLGTSTINITEAGINAWNADETNLTLEPENATFNFTYNGNDTVHFSSGGIFYTYNVVNFSNAKIFVSRSANFNSLNISPGATLIIKSDNIITSNALSISGTCALPIFIRATENIRANIEIPSGTINGTYLYLKDINATGGAIFNASNTVDEGNNLGWNITAPVGPANLFWIGQTGNWYDASNWSTTSGGAPANCIPNTNTNVFFDANSFSAAGQTVTVDYNAYCNSMNWTGAIAANFSGGYDVTLRGSLTLNTLVNFPLTGNFNFIGNGAITINTFNRPLNSNLFLNNASGNFSITSAITTSGGVILNNGSLNTNNQDITAAFIRSNNIDNTRTINIGSSIITLNGDNEAWDLDNNNLTFSSSNSVFNLNHAGINKMIFKGADYTYQDININTSTAEILGSNTFKQIKISGGSKVAFESDATQIFDSLIANGTCGAPIIISATEVLGGTATLSKTSAAPTNVNFAYISNVVGDISSGQVYNATNTVLQYTTTGWNATAPSATGTTFYWIGGTGVWNDTLNWSLSSGGVPTGCLPTINDTVVFDANSFNAAGQIVAVNVDAYCNLMNWTNATNNPNLNILQTLTVRRDLLLNPNMTTSGNRESFVRFLPNNNNCNLNTQNIELNANILLEGSLLTDSLKLANNLLMNDSLNTINIIKGSFITNNRNITSGSVNIITGEDKQITLGSSLINLRYGWSALGITSGLNVSAGTSHIIINGDRTGEFFNGAGETYYDVTINSGGDIKSVITASNTFRRLTVNAGVDLELEASTTQTTQRFRAIGLCTDSISIRSSIDGTQATITQNGDSILAEVASIKDIVTAGAGSAKVARFCTNEGNNTGWNFLAIQPAVANFTYPATLCRGNAINFTNTSTAANGNVNSLTFKWEFGTGDTSALLNPSYTYTQGGRIGVTLTATYLNGCTSTKTDSIDVNDLEVQIISSASSGVVCQGVPVTFTTLNNATTYQFFRNGIALAPASVDTFITINNLQNNDSVSVISTLGGCGFPSNVGLRFTVNPAPTPTVISSDADNIICTGERIKFTGSGADEFLFYLNGNEVGFFSDIDSFITTSLVTGDVVRMKGKTASTQCEAFAPQTFTFTVNPIPTVTLTSSDSDNIICAGESVTYTASGAAQYQFTINGNPVGGFSANNTFTSTTLQQGNVVRVIGRTNGCDGTSNSFTMNVNPLPNVTLNNNTANNTLCAGDNVLFSAAGATAYEFFINNISQGPPSVTTNFNSTSLSNGDIVSVIGQTLGCAAPQVSNTMTVIIPPTVTLTSSDADNVICLNESVTFTASGAATYEFFIGSTSQGAPGTQNTFTTTSILDGQTVEVIGYQGGCPSNGNSSYTFSVKQIPLVNIFSSDFDNIITRCEEITFTGLGATTYEFFINGISQGAPSANNSLTSSAFQNNQEIFVRGVANGCPNNSDTITITVNPAPPVNVSFSTPTTICEGTNVIFAASGADQYEYYLNGNLVQGPATTTLYSNANLNNGDEIFVLGYTFGCANSSDTITFTVNTFPNVTLTSSVPSNTICLNESVTFTASGANEYEFLVNGVSQGAPSTQNTFTTSSLLNNQNIRVIGTSNGCATTSSPIVFTVNPLPSISLFSSDLDNTICFGDNITFTALGGNQYEFFVDGVSQGPPSNVNTFSTTALPVGIPEVYVVGSQGNCSRASLDTFAITVVALPNVSLVSSSANNIICSGDTVVFTASGASQYRFFINNTAQGNFSLNNIFTTASLTNNQTVRVLGSDNGCISQGTPTFTMAVNPLPNTAIVSSDIDRVICNGDNVVFTGSGADLYEFFINGISQGASSNINQINTSTLADSSLIRVTGTTNGCSKSSGTLLFRVNPLPVVGLTSSVANNTICSGENVTFTASGAQQYQFFVNGNALTNPSVTAVRNITTLANGDVVSVKGFNQFGCENFSAQTFTMIVNPTPVVTLISSDADNEICAREEVTFTASGAQQYQFYIGNNAATTLSNNNVYVTDTITNGQTIRVLGVSGNCQAFSSAAYTFTVNTFPAVTLSSSAATNNICEDDAITFTSSGADLYEFFINNISQGAASINNTFTTTDIQNGQTVSVKGTNGSCISNGNNTYTYTVRPLPVVNFTANPATTQICYGTPITFTSSGASSYEYFVNGISQGISANNTYSINDIENNDVITVKGYTNGCGNFASNNFNYTVNKLNLNVTVTGGIGMICENSPTTFTASGADQYQFFVDGVSQGAPSANNTLTLNNITDGQVVTVEGTSNTTGCTQPADATFTMSVLPTPLITPAIDTNICKGDTITLTSNYAKGNQWYKNGNRIVGAESQTLKVFESGTYSLETFRGGNGNVWTIGNNAFGQLGDTTNNASDEAIILPVFENLTDIDAGLYFNIASDTNGNVFTWGRNDFGQLGDGTFSDENYPKRIQIFNNAKAVSAGDEFSLVLTQTGTVFSFGKNVNGQLGQGNTGTQPFPFQINNFNDVDKIAAGGQHAVALKTNGTVWAWGDNAFGQLGINSLLDKYTPNFVIGLSDIISVAAGRNHSVAIKADGTVWTWGNNAKGQLGIGNVNFATTATQIVGISNAIKAAAGEEHTLILTSNGRVYAFGGNDFGQLGINSTVAANLPVRITELNNVKDIYAGAFNSFAIKNDGSTWAWGLNTFYQLAIGNNNNQLQPVLAKELAAAKAIGAGLNHTAMLTDVKVVCQPNPITVTVNDIAEAQISSVGNGLTTNAGGVSYQWYYNGVAIPNGTQQTLPTTSNGNYQVAITNQFGCTTLSDVYSFNVGIASISGNNPYITFYPNPTNGMVYVKTENLGQQKLGKIEVINILGKTILNINAETLLQNNFIDLREQSSGMYFIHTTIGDSLYIDKIILNSF